MKISNSKKQLAKIIHENGGWHDRANWYVQHHTKRVVASEERPVFDDGVWCSRYFFGGFFAERVRAWHQTVLSRDEYFHLYPAPVKVVVENKTTCHLTVADKPTIEQLAVDYQNAKDYADRKQQEADAAKAGAEEKLAELVAAGKALGLAVSVAEPELVITDWRDLRVGDEISVQHLKNVYSKSAVLVVGDSEVGIRNHAGARKTVNLDERGWRFIRRPAKGGNNA